MSCYRDWSSDVCSSDLDYRRCQYPLGHPYARKPFQRGDRVDIDISGNRFYSRNTLPVSVSGLTHLGNARGGVNPAEIGRASCREEVDSWTGVPDLMSDV